MGMLRDLADQRAAVGLGHPVLRLDFLIGIDFLIEPGLQRVSGIWFMIAAPSTSQPIVPMSAQVSVG